MLSLPFSLYLVIATLRVPKDPQLLPAQGFMLPGSDTEWAAVPGGQWPASEAWMPHLYYGYFGFLQCTI